MRLLSILRRRRQPSVSELHSEAEHHKISHHLSHTQPAWDAEPGSHIRALPWEIILSILDYVDNPSILCFLMTCRLYYLSLKSQIPRLTHGENLLVFLRLLDKECPDWVLCDICLKLVRWNKTWEPSLWDEKALFCHPDCHCPRSTGSETGDARNSWSSCSSCSSKYFLHHSSDTVSFLLGHHLAPSEWNLTFSVAYLIMRSHFQGPKYGFHLSRFDWEEQHSRTWIDHDESSRYPLTFFRSQAARIIKNELYFRRQVRVITSPQRFKRMRSANDLSFGQLCNHLFSNVAGLQENNGNYQAYHNVGWSCGRCRTDYSVTIQRHGSDGMWMYEVTIYVNLGSCQGPQEWEWSSWASRYNFRESRWVTKERVKQHGESDLGYVKKCWLVDAGEGDKLGRFEGFQRC